MSSIATQRKQITVLNRGLDTAKGELTQAQAELVAATKEANGSETPRLAAARDRFIKAANGFGTTSSKLTQAQAELLADAKGFKGMGGEIAVAGRFVDLEDAASLSRDEQVKLFGAPVRFTPDEALAKDVKLIGAAASDANAAQMVASQLELADPAYRAKLVGALSDAQLEKMAAAANKSPEAAKAMVQVASQLDGPQRERVASAIAKKLVARTGFQRSEMMNALGAKLKDGQGFEVAADLLGKVKGEAGDELKLVTAGAMQGLRRDFEGKAKKVENTNAHLASLVHGFGGMLSKEQVEQGVAKFSKRHEKEQVALDASAKKYLAAVDVMGRLPRLPPGEHKELQKGIKAWENLGHNRSDMNLSGAQVLDDELTRLNQSQNFERLFETTPGKEKLDAALKRQLTGERTFIEDFKKAGDESGGAIDFVKDKLPTMVAKGIGRAALLAPAGSDQMMKMLKSNAGLLGVSDGALGEFEQLAKGLKSTSKADVNAALGKLDSADYGKGLKTLGVALALPGVLSTLAGGDTTALDKVKGFANLASFSKDIAGLVSDSKVIEAVGKRIGNVAGAVTGAVDVLQGISKLADGNIMGGVGSTLSGAGALILSVSRLASVVPGGQLAGAVLAVAGFVFSAFETSESRKAEKAAQADGAAFLEGAGLPKGLATSLSNMRESDHRNIGPFIKAFAEYVGIPQDKLVEKMGKMDSDELHMFTDMALNMRMNKDGSYDKTQTQPFDYGMPVHTDDGWVGSQNLEGLKRYATRHLGLSL